MDIDYLLGVIPRTGGTDMEYADYMIIYTPPGSELAKEALIGLYEPKWRGNGGSAPAATWLARNAEPWRKGWFERQLFHANCAWLIPILQRLAANEDVPLADIQAAYASHNGGREMQRGTHQQLCELVSRLTT